MAVFRARARSVDMLGRQQIAGPATAISEIFKNAHDAYASLVRADLLGDRHCLAIRDDGVGMSPDTFDEAWLTLATDSKVDRQPIEPPQGMTRRPVLGAKGIGRLAIAILGPHVLVLTQSAELDARLVVALINWSAFQLPGVDLDEVEIPLRYFPHGSLPTPSDIRTLVDSAMENVRSIARNKDTQDLMLASLDSFDVHLVDSVMNLGGPQLTGSGHGTHFFISPVAGELIQQAGSGVDTSELTLDLAGFANTMTPRHSAPSIRTSFWLHRGAQQSTDILSEAEFLTVEEFLSADHHVAGRFDEFGSFAGAVSVYGNQEVSYELPWRHAAGPSRCGPFELAFAIIQGNSTDSVLSPREHQRLSRKLARMGGIYVYREGIRVLPYGRPDFDWLGVEQRRTMNLGKAFYSHRRLFGAVSITNEKNAGLQEKAGREGFQQNAAYRDLRSILQEFLQQSASDFFVAGGSKADSFVREKAVLQRETVARREADRRKREVEQQRRSLAEQIARAYLFATDGGAAEEARDAIATFERRVQDLAEGEGVDALEVEEFRAANRLADIQRRLEVIVPPELGLTRELKRDLAALEAARVECESAVVSPARSRIDEVGRSLRRAERTAADLAIVVRQAESRLRRDADAAESLLRSAAARLNQRTETLVDRVEAQLTEEVGRLVGSIEASGQLAEDYVTLRVELEQQVDRIFDKGCQVLTSFASAIDEVEWFQQNGDIFTSASVFASLDEEIADLRDSANESIDLVQQGMALAIVDHEFQLIVTELRRSLRELNGWADLNPSLRPLYERMSSSFEHLDGFLALFTPLQRRMNTRPTIITGSDIYRFTEALFGQRLRADSITLIATEGFLNRKIRGYRSTWYPVYVNLVDNATYWVSQSPPPRTITLDGTESRLSVSDSGPGVRPEDRAMIWEARFSRRPSGRGLGLTVAREVLRRDGFDLTLHETSAAGATFLIQPLSSSVKGAD